jgi:hypothetical protein
MPGHSYWSYSEPVLTFGLGENKLVDELRVTWPDGGETVLRGVAVNQLLTLRRES